MGGVWLNEMGGVWLDKGGLCELKGGVRLDERKGGGVWLDEGGLG